MDFEVDVVELQLHKRYKIKTPVAHIYGVEDAGQIFSQQIGLLNVENVSLICLDSTNKINVDRLRSNRQGKRI